MLSHVVDLGSDAYAVGGTKVMNPGHTLFQCDIKNVATVRVLYRLQGGASGNMDIPGQWQCRVRNAQRCWPTRKRCYRCDAPRDHSNSDGPVLGPIGRAPQQTRNNVPPMRNSGPRHVPPSNAGGPPPGAGVGPGTTTPDSGKKA